MVIDSEDTEVREGGEDDFEGRKMGDHPTIGEIVVAVDDFQLTDETRKLRRGLEEFAEFDDRGYASASGVRGAVKTDAGEDVRLTVICPRRTNKGASFECRSFIVKMINDNLDHFLWQDGFHARRDVGEAWNVMGDGRPHTCFCMSVEVAEV